MTTETLDKLYLEWSQFTKARTSRELALTEALVNLLNMYVALGNSGDIGFCDPEKESEVMAARRALAQ